MSTDSDKAPVVTRRITSLSTRETMNRVSVRFTEEQLDGLEQLVDQGAFPHRSEAIRAAIRRKFNSHPPQSQE